MRQDLEKFIRENRDKFDELQPSDAMWARIEKQMKPPVRNGRVRMLGYAKWAVAAVLVLVAGSLVWKYTQNPAKTSSVAVVKSEKDTGNHFVGNPNDSADRQMQPQDFAVGQPDDRDMVKGGHSRQRQVQEYIEPSVSQEELYHYTKLIEARQKQMEHLKQDAPQLYEQFSGDVQKLQESHTSLLHKLKAGYNDDQVLEAMLKNLKMQSELLDKQIEIIKFLKEKDHNNETNHHDI
ncbi:MAG: hypothetical protein QM727_09080 [Niabella sp.]